MFDFSHLLLSNTKFVSQMLGIARRDSIITAFRTWVEDWVTAFRKIEDELGRGPSQDESSCPSDPCLQGLPNFSAEFSTHFFKIR